MKLLKDYIVNLENSIELISTNWVSSQSAQTILDNYNINEEDLRVQYLMPILIYFVGVLKEKNSHGQCPALSSLIDFLADKELSPHELFLLCSQGKKETIKICFDSSHMNFELFDDLYTLFDLNFAGVMQEYFTTIESKKIKSLEDIIDENIILSKTDLKGKITFATKKFEEISGYSKHELIGANHNIVRSPKVSSDEFKELWATIQNRQTWYGILRNKRKDGSEYIVNTTVKPILGSNNEIIEYVSIREDITEINEKQELLHSQSRLAAMGEMINMISHQWRQPLNSLGIDIQKVKKDFKRGNIDDDYIKYFTTEAMVTINHMSDTIDDFTSFFKQDKYKSDFFVKDIVKKSISILKGRINDTGVYISLSDNTFKLHSYASEFSQVILNLINNAIDILIDKDIKNPIITIGIDEHNRSLSVQDNAGGVPADIIDNIFEPYFSTKLSKNGTGIGLYMSKQIIEDHMDATLSVSNSNSGAKFTITF